MRIAFTIFAIWLALATPAALIIARLLRSLPQPPARTVDDWAPVTVDAEFASIVRDWVETQR